MFVRMYIRSNVQNLKKKSWSFTPLWAVDHNFFKTQNYQLLNGAFDRQCTHLSTHVQNIISTKYYWRRCALKRHFFKFFLFKGSKPWKSTVVLETVSTLVPVLPYRQYSSREQSSINSEVSKLLSSLAGQGGWTWPGSVAKWSFGHISNFFFQAITFSIFWTYLRFSLIDSCPELRQKVQNEYLLSGIVSKNPVDGVLNFLETSQCHRFCLKLGDHFIINEFRQWLFFAATLTPISSHHVWSFLRSKFAHRSFYRQFSIDN